MENYSQLDFKSASEGEMRGFWSRVQCLSIVNICWSLFEVSVMEMPTFMKLGYGYGRNGFLVTSIGSSAQVGCNSLHLYGCSYIMIQASTI